MKKCNIKAPIIDYEKINQIIELKSEVIANINSRVHFILSHLFECMNIEYSRVKDFYYNNELSKQVLYLRAFFGRGRIYS